MYTRHANLTNQCLLNVAFSMTKALNNESSPKQSFHSLHQNFQNPASIIACFRLFHTTFFISTFIKFQLTSLQLGSYGLWANQI